MKLIHLSDLHIGKIVNGFNMLEDQRFALEQIIRLAEEQQVGGVMIAGDIYDKSDPTAEAISLFDWFLGELSEKSITVLAIPGNHDSADRIAYARGILAKQAVYFPTVYQGSVDHVEINDEHGTVHFWLLPFLKPANVRKYFPDEEIDQSYTKAIQCALNACDLNENERNVLLAHQFVTASGCETIREESELVLGGIDNVDASVFNQFDYVALGHVHRPQQIGCSTTRYSGSLLKYSFSEARYPKSAVLVEIGEKVSGSHIGECVSFSQLTYPTLHDMRKIKGPLDLLISSNVVATADANDYLHVTLTDGPTLDAMARLRTVYPNVMQLDYEENCEGPNASLHENLDIKQLDPFALFDSFFLDQTGHDLNDNQRAIVRKELQCALEKHDEGREGN